MRVTMKEAREKLCYRTLGDHFELCKSTNCMAWRWETSDLHKISASFTFNIGPEGYVTLNEAVRVLVESKYDGYAYGEYDLNRFKNGQLRSYGNSPTGSWVVSLYKTIPDEDRYGYCGACEPKVAEIEPG